MTTEREREKLILLQHDLPRRVQRKNLLFGIFAFDDCLLFCIKCNEVMRGVGTLLIY